MTPIEIILTTMLILSIASAAAFAYQAHQNTQHMRQWWADYQLLITELDQTLKNHAPLQQQLKLHNESGEMVKQPCAQDETSPSPFEDNVVFLNAVNEEQRWKGLIC